MNTTCLVSLFLLFMFSLFSIWSTNDKFVIWVGGLGF